MVARGGMHGCSGAACMVAPGGHAWLLPGGHAWLPQGGMHGCSGGGCLGVLAWGVQVAPGGVSCMVAPWGGVHDTEIRSMSGRYASYWNAFLLRV